MDYQLTPNNTLSFRYGYSHSDIQDAGIGSFNLVSRGYHTQNDHQHLQASETAVIGSHVVNEVRFQYFRSNMENLANSLTPAIQVLGSFNGGGAQVGHSFDTQSSYEFQDYISVLRGTHSFRFGVRARDLSLTSAGEPGTLPGTVYVVEPMGDEVYVEVLIADSRVTVRADRGWTAPLGASVGVCVDPATACFFEPGGTTAVHRVGDRPIQTGGVMQ